MDYSCSAIKFRSPSVTFGYLRWKKKIRAKERTWKSIKRGAEISNALWNVLCITLLASIIMKFSRTSLFFLAYCLCGGAQNVIQGAPMNSDHGPPINPAFLQVAGYGSTAPLPMTIIRIINGILPLINHTIIKAVISIISMATQCQYLPYQHGM